MEAAKGRIYATQGIVSCLSSISMYTILEISRQNEEITERSKKSLETLWSDHRLIIYKAFLFCNTFKMTVRI